MDNHCPFAPLPTIFAAWRLNRCEMALAKVGLVVYS